MRDGDGDAGCRGAVQRGVYITFRKAKQPKIASVFMNPRCPLPPFAVQTRMCSYL